MRASTLKITGLVLGALLCGASVASAALITYVDAVQNGNTTLADGSTWNTTSAEADDGLWRARTGITGINGGTVFEAYAGETSTPVLRTTITGLVAGSSYNMYAYFWAVDAATTGNGDWDLSAGFAEGTLTGYKPSLGSATDLSGVTPATYFTDGTVTVAGDNREIYEADLGIFAADSSGNIAIYIDDYLDDGTGATTRDRTWYDGVGYEAIPEPATLGLVAVFGGAVLFLRRKMMI